MINKFLLLIVVFHFFACKSKEELLISKIEILLEIDSHTNDSIQSILCISIKPLNQEILIPKQIVFKDNLKEYKVHFNNNGSDNILRSNLDYCIDYKKIKSEKDFEQLKSKVNQLKFYLPNGQKLEKTNEFKIEKGTFKKITKDDIIL